MTLIPRGPKMRAMLSLANSFRSRIPTNRPLPREKVESWSDNYINSRKPWIDRYREDMAELSVTSVPRHHIDSQIGSDDALVTGYHFSRCFPHVKDSTGIEKRSARARFFNKFESHFDSHCDMVDIFGEKVDLVGEVHRCNYFHNCYLITRAGSFVESVINRGDEDCKCPDHVWTGATQLIGGLTVFHLVLNDVFYDHQLYEAVCFGLNLNLGIQPRHRLDLAAMKLVLFREFKPKHTSSSSKCFADGEVGQISQCCPYEDPRVARAAQFAVSRYNEEKDSKVLVYRGVIESTVQTIGQYKILRLMFEAINLVELGVVETEDQAVNWYEAIVLLMGEEEEMELAMLRLGGSPRCEYLFLLQLRPDDSIRCSDDQFDVYVR